ncbi:SHOCT domain-containing protein [Planococcus halocryophilus]|uniref:SHOCT domain-containing protein n=1 Tax=Planococcus halocryophilus TaxID=1215089 RepID=A0A1C7DUY8_9BACL|nr:SHOCT domain-containing protein [Planococcus halocryophilus]ANU15275.1 hypothetical protein BBI08_16070 [Planococcus halocryophilus]
MMGPGWGMGWGMGGGSWLIAGLVVLIGFAIYYFMKNNNNNNSFNSSQKDSSTDAMEIAKKRLARGEITNAEFEEIKKRLL